MRTETRLAGLGGQGLVVAGRVLGEAACLHDGLYAVQMAFYGPEVRGGEAGADVIISDGPIYEVMIHRPDVLIVLWQGAYDQYASRVAQDGLVLWDEDLVIPKAALAGAIAHRAVPATRTAERLGTPVVANVVMLGALMALRPDCRPEAVQAALRTVFVDSAEINLVAFAAGLALGKEFP